MLIWTWGSRTKSFSPSTSFAVLCTVPSLLGGFSRGPRSLAIGAGFDPLCTASSEGRPPLDLVCLNPFDPPFCGGCGLYPLLPEPVAVLGREPLETFWWVFAAGGDDWVGIVARRSRPKLGGVYVWLDVDLGRDMDGVELCCL